MGVSILDLTGHNPNTRLPNSEFRSLNGLREWLRIHCINELGEFRNVSTIPRLKLRHSSNIRTQVGETNIDSDDDNYDPTIKINQCVIA